WLFHGRTARRVLMATDQNNSSPPQSPGWRTASQLARRFVGSQPSIARRMTEVRRALIADAPAAGLSPAAAEAMVDGHLIGMQPERSGREQPRATPEAVPLLGLTDRSQVEPPPPEGWMSATQLSRQLRIDDRQIVELVVQLYRESVDTLQRAGYPEHE